MERSSLVRRTFVAAGAALGGLLLVAGSFAAAPPVPVARATSAPAAVQTVRIVPDPQVEHRQVLQQAAVLTSDAAKALAAQQAAEAQKKAEAEKAAEAAQQAQAAASAQAAPPAEPAPVQAAPPAAPPAAPVPAQQAPAPAAPPTAYIPVVAAGGQSAVDACMGPVHFTPVTVSVDIAEHDYCGGWSRMSWIQPGTLVTVQGYGTFTAFQRMIVANSAPEGVLAGFAGGYPPIILQTCIPGTSQMIVIGLH